MPDSTDGEMKRKKEKADDEAATPRPVLSIPVLVEPPFANATTMMAKAPLRSNRTKNNNPAAAMMGAIHLVSLLNFVADGKSCIVALAIAIILAVSHSLYNVIIAAGGSCPEGHAVVYERIPGHRLEGFPESMVSVVIISHTLSFLTQKASQSM